MVLTSKAPQFIPLSACRPVNALGADVNRPFERRSSSLARTRLNSKRMHAETERSVIRVTALSAEMCLGFEENPSLGVDFAKRSATTNKCIKEE
jgi:hypothetical protein